MLDVFSIKQNNIPMAVFKIIALDLLVIRHCRVNCMRKIKFSHVMALIRARNCH